MVLFEKFGQHQPLNRQCERFAREGVEISLSTLADQVGACAAVLKPLLTLMETHVMAGERLHAGPYREVSGVCTHPDYQGRGLARRLSEKIVRLQMQRGQLPFLHVISTNETAHSLYERMGFRDYKETVVRVVEKSA